MTQHANWHDLAIEHLQRRAQWDHEDFLRQKRRDDNGLVIMAALSLIGIGFLLGAALI